MYVHIYIFDIASFPDCAMPHLIQIHVPSSQDHCGATKACDACLESWCNVITTEYNWCNLGKCSVTKQITMIHETSP